ncbi:cytochrome c oxidase assembly protein [Gordonia sp. (in: high G+C Gram-positive bacteria)]|uniref:cytochrome c oxidase assembly protein n=1 Tax=Gordonia sp. (in: high G+C Gram-positive bacteria) TaxID=84139 RepID=UPI002623FA36|nr:cytochrome c oxidase assembly protein [Gordonia sp. (in: high G+C Gram-positive bacteria)]
MSTTTARTTTREADRDSMRDPSNVRRLLVSLMMVAGVIAAAVVTAASVATAQKLLGVPDPGWLTTYGVRVVTVIGQLFAAIGFGGAVFAAFFVPPQASGELDVGGYRAMRWSSVAFACWSMAALAMIPLSASNASGIPLGKTTRGCLTTIGNGGLLGQCGIVADTRYWLWTAIFAICAAALARAALRWGWTVLVIGLGFLSLMPSALLGHSSAGGNHDLGTNSLILHIVAAALWTGGLVVVLAYCFAGGRWRMLAVRRYSRVAFWCFLVVAASGVINALVRMSVAQLFTTTYGLVVVAKFVALLIAGGMGAVHRSRTITALEATDQPRTSLFVRLAAVETVVFAIAFGLAAGLSQTPPPVLASADISPTELKIGYRLDGPFSLEKLAFDWRFDLIFGTFAIVAALVYLGGVWRLRKRGDAWPVGRTIAWLLGCAALLIATSSGMGKYAPAMFSVHMMSHMMLSMLVPVLMVLGAPVTLALRAIPPAGRGQPPGPREWILSGIHSKYSRFITHPAIAVTVFVGSFYVLYLGGVFQAVVDDHSAHLLMNLHFLISGYLFYWLVIGIDPAPRQISPPAKFGVVVGSLPFHAFFGVALMMTSAVIAESWYKSLELPWHYDLFGDQQVGGGIAWATGEFPLMLVMIALLIQWQRSDTRQAKRFDRREDRNDDAELESYNAMLAQMNTPGRAAEEPADRAVDDAAAPVDAGRD